LATKQVDRGRKKGVGDSKTNSKLTKRRKFTKNLLDTGGKSKNQKAGGASANDPKFSQPVILNKRQYVDAQEGVIR